jgi:NADH pyrophosphatase NudC (nudix superfamily)
MNVLIFSDADAQELKEIQGGLHQLAPVPLTDGRWFLMADILSELPDGIYKNKLIEVYSLDTLANISHLIPVVEFEA